MNLRTCTTCHGAGRVPDALPAPPSRTLVDALTTVAGGTCSCDGPPHTYSPGWCPASGPVTRRS